MVTKNRTIGKELSTSNADIYTVPSRYTAKISSIVVSNMTSGSVTFSLDWYDSGSSTYFTIAEQTVLKPNSVVQITDGFILQAGDKFRGLASAANSVTISMAVEEDYSVVV